MKVLILSDIHSNITALEAIWAKEQDSDLPYNLRPVYQVTSQVQLNPNEMRAAQRFLPINIAS